MNLIIHQFKTDWWHFRLRLAVLWLCFAIEPVLADFHLMPEIGAGITRFLLEICQAVFAFALVASLVQADSLMGSNAGWLTRPMRRTHLFWAKSSFIVLCLFIPRLAIQSLEWILRGHSLQLYVAALEQSLLFSVALVLVIAVLAGLTNDFSRFFLAIGITVGGIFAWTVIVEMLVHGGVLHKASTIWGTSEAERSASATAVAFLMLAIAAFFAWVSQAREGRSRMAVYWLAAGLLIYPVITTVWSKNFLSPKETSSAPLTISLQKSGPQFDKPTGQLLSSELSVNGVAAGDVAVLQDISARILFTNEQRATDLLRDPYPTHPGRTRPAGSAQRDEYFNAIRGFFPAKTLWFYNDFGRGPVSAFYNDKIFKKYTNRPPPGDLDGAVIVDLFSVKKVAEEPLRVASFLAQPGVHVSIQKVRLADNVITISVDESIATLMFNRSANTAGHDQGGGNETFCTYVLYHPDSGEAFVVSQRISVENFPSLLGGESHRMLELRFSYPALRERFAGVTASDWLHEARLCVFVAGYEGTSHLSFRQDNYVWPHIDRDARVQRKNLDDARIIKSATIPANPTPAQMDVYLDEILVRVNWNAALRRDVQTKLAAVGTNGLSALLRRLPLTQNVEDNFVIPVVTALITRDQLPELCSALQRDINLIQVFQTKHWEADARDVLIAKLPDHSHPLTAEEQRIIAESKNPATYADLRWHFIHLDSGHDRVVDALEQCPGFDAAGAVREAWLNARLGITSVSDMAPIAAKYGLPDALDLAVANLGEARSAKGDQYALKQLAALTGYDGGTNNMLPWLTSNLTRFQYSAAQQRYILEPDRP